MTQYQIALVALLIAQAVTIALLYITKNECYDWRDMWLRDATELLEWKRNAVRRDPKTGKYIKKDKRNG
jgi:hypothetical protein